MIVDFEQIVGDTRYWLRHGSTELVFNNPLGRVRKKHSNYELLTPTMQCLEAHELRTLGGTCIGGGLKIHNINRGKIQGNTELIWTEDDMAARSVLLGRDSELQPLYEFTGKQLETLYAQLALPISSIIERINCSNNLN